MKEMPKDGKVTIPLNMSEVYKDKESGHSLFVSGID
jgi:hypothetical protein